MDFACQSYGTNVNFACIDNHTFTQFFVLHFFLSPKIAVEPLAFRVVWKSLNREELPENVNKYGGGTMS